MNNYLIRFDEAVIISVNEIPNDVELLGANNQHLVCPLTDAIIFFTNAGYDIDKLIFEFNK